MANNTFTAGVVPGGLTDHSEIKILICCVLQSLEGPINHDDLLAALTFKGYANYFECADAVTDLLAAGHIAQNEEGAYSLLESGASIAQTLQRDIPRTVLERVREKAQNLYRHTANKKYHLADIVKRERDLLVDCRVCSADGSELFGLRVPAPDKAAAQRIREAFIDEAEHLFRFTMQTLTGESFEE